MPDNPQTYPARRRRTSEAESPVFARRYLRAAMGAQSCLVVFTSVIVENLDDDVQLGIIDGRERE